MFGLGGRTRISVRWSSGMSASFSPWILGITSYGLRGDVSFLTGDWGMLGWLVGWGLEVGAYGMA
jgi:hypothetical protein